MVGKDKNPAPVGEGQEQEKAATYLGQSEVHITKDAVILLVHQKSHRHSAQIKRQHREG